MNDVEREFLELFFDEENLLKFIGDDRRLLLGHLEVTIRQNYVEMKKNVDFDKCEYMLHKNPNELSNMCVKLMKSIITIKVTLRYFVHMYDLLIIIMKIYGHKMYDNILNIAANFKFGGGDECAYKIKYLMDSYIIMHNIDMLNSPLKSNANIIKSARSNEDKI